MEKYLKALENLKKRFGDWVNPIAIDGLLAVALQDRLLGWLSEKDYAKLCVEVAKVQYPDEQPEMSLDQAGRLIASTAGKAAI